jgi:hypothetical protein
LGNGAQGRNRTTDTVIFSHVLYQLSYLGLHLGVSMRQSPAVIETPPAPVQGPASRTPRAKGPASIAIVIAGVIGATRRRVPSGAVLAVLVRRRLAAGNGIGAPQPTR